MYLVFPGFYAEENSPTVASPFLLTPLSPLYVSEQGNIGPAARSDRSGGRLSCMKEYAQYHGGGGALELQFQALKQIPGTAGCFTVTLRVCGPLSPGPCEAGAGDPGTDPALRLRG